LLHRTTEQLRYGGVLEAVRVARSGFPVRLNHHDFYSRYRALANPFHSRSSKLPLTLNHSMYMNNEKAKEQCVLLLEAIFDDYIPAVERSAVIISNREHIASAFGNSVTLEASCSTTIATMQGSSKSMKSLSSTLDIILWRGKSTIPKESIQLGLTKVFLRKAAHDVLEGRRSRRLFVAARRIQAVARCRLKRKKYVAYSWACRFLQRVVRGMRGRKIARKLRLTKAAVAVQTCFRSYAARSEFQMLKRSVTILQSIHRGFGAKVTAANLRKIRNVIRLQKVLRRLNAQYKYRWFVYATIRLQCGYRKRKAKQELIKLRLAAKDLGVLKQNNAELKAEIEQLRKKAAEVTKKNEEKISMEKDLEIQRLTRELSDLRSLYDTEMKLRTQAEEKIVEFEKNQSKNANRNKRDEARSTRSANTLSNLSFESMNIICNAVNALLKLCQLKNDHSSGFDVPVAFSSSMQILAEDFQKVLFFIILIGTTVWKSVLSFGMGNRGRPK
jgi:myosin heavy subunit